MEKLIVNFENCYWISKLEYTFLFEWNKKSYEIYAPNWTMKTSFAKTFKDFSENIETKDLIYTNRKTIREIKDENWIEIDKNSIFVIESYVENFKSKNMWYLLVNQELKEKYDEITENILQEKEILIKEIKNISWSSDCENEIIESFSDWNNKNFIDIVLELKDLLIEVEPYDFKYNDIFDKWKKVKNFLAKNIKYISDYVENYNKMLNQSDFFTNTTDKFWTYQAKNILKSVSDDKFFKAWHKFTLKNWITINTAKEYQEMIEWEIKKIIQSDELKSIFEKIDDELAKNESIRKFKEILESHNEILIELRDFEWFRKKVRINYLSQKKDLVAHLLESFNSKKDELNSIIEQAKKTRTKWQDVIDEFNERFSNMPFRLSVENKDDVILKTVIPTINFVYNDWRDEQEDVFINEENLKKTLSQWEKRALYLLNIIFEIQARKAKQKETLLIIDDIADSFDYKNKYSIIQYLKDLSEDPLFSMIILTHNFDFFRTVCYRKIVDGNCCLITNKYNDKISIEEEKEISFFDNLKEKLKKGNLTDKELIAFIPFARNIAQYTLNKTDYEKLCCFLHIKNETRQKTLWDLVDVINSIIRDEKIDFSNIEKDISMPIVDFIFRETENILNDNWEKNNLENKIILSMAIRLKTELFLEEKIDKDGILDSKWNQTIKLIEKYKEKFPEDRNNKLFEKVILMTPENIHINAFMYEPIIDMWENELRKLYKEVSVLS